VALQLHLGAPGTLSGGSRPWPRGHVPLAANAVAEAAEERGAEEARGEGDAEAQVAGQDACEWVAGREEEVT